MTLIQVILTRDHIVQVSDRRSTKPNGTVFDDEHNKAVSWCGKFMIGFTGIAYIDRRPTEPTSECIWR